MAKSIRELCLAPAGQVEILQGNIAFAVGCVRGGVHAADGYPGTPSSEVIDRGLSQVQDLITVGWSVNEAVAAGVGMGHTLAGRDCVVTMKIPGLYQAADIFTSGALFGHERGALVYYIASDFTPSSTQHTLDPRYLFKSSFVPVIEPRNHQEMHEAAALAVELSRQFRTQVVVMPNGTLCHSEGLVNLMPPQKRQPVNMPASLKPFMVLPGIARKNYDRVMTERMPALQAWVETCPLNRWERADGRVGVITAGASDLYLREVMQTLGLRYDVLSLGVTNPLPLDLLRSFYHSIDGPVYVIEDGYRFIQEAAEAAGLKVVGKPLYTPLTEWTPALIADLLGVNLTPALPPAEPVKALPSHSQGEGLGVRVRPAPAATSLAEPVKAPVAEPVEARPVNRPPVICAGCPYRLVAGEIALLRKKKQLDTVFGDIGCNTLLFFMDAEDTSLAMGASESERIGYVLSRPEQVGRCLSVLGDSTECHSGMDATRNAVYRNVAGVKVVLDNSWTGMTGGQPSPTSPANLAGQEMAFDLPAALRATGAKVETVPAYDKMAIRKALKTALSEAEQGVFTTLVVNEGMCIQKAKPSRQRVQVDPAVCKKCNACLICPGLEIGPDGVPVITNLCSGCGGESPACVQMCPTHVLHVVNLDEVRPAAAKFATPPELPPLAEPVTEPVEVVEAPLAEPVEAGEGLGVRVRPAPIAALPERLSVAIRGVGGQGSLFFGSVLSQLAFLAGYGDANVVKGETHGMAQMGGPVISTFACGAVTSPVPLPGTVDCLIVLEKSEVLRPDFLEMLKPGGTVLLANTRLLPPGLPEDQYPADEAIRASLAGFDVVEVDVLGQALALGDTSGRSANVVMMGVLSRLEPFNRFPENLWLTALKQANSKPAVWAANYAAFKAGRNL